MAITFRTPVATTAYLVGSPVSTFVATKPTGLANGDLWLVHFVMAATATITVPSGWTAVFATEPWGASAQHSMYYRVVADAASEPASYNFARSGGSTTHGVIASGAVAGVDTANPIMVVSATSEGVTNPINHPSVTTTAANAALLFLAAVGSSSSTNTPPTGTPTATEWYDANGANLVTMSYAIQAAAGASTARTTTCSNTGRDYGARTVALKEAAGTTHQGAAALTASATLAAVGTRGALASAALSAQATQAAAGTVAVSGQAALAATGTLASAGGLAVGGAAALTAQATLAAVGTRGALGAAALTAQATQAVAGTVAVATASALTATATQAAAGTVAVAGVAALAGSAALAADGTVAVGLADDFTDGTIDAAKWVEEEAAGTVVTETGGQLAIAGNSGGTGYGAIRSVTSAYALTGGSVYVEIPQPLNAAAATETYLQVEIDSSNYYRFVITGSPRIIAGDQLLAGALTTVFTASYDATNHRWLRIRHDSGTNKVHFDTSPDGTTWTSRGNLTPGVAVSALRVRLAAGAWSATASQGTALFDNLNTPPAVVVTGAAALTATSTLAAAGAVALTGAAAFTATGTQAAAGLVAVAGVTALPATGTLAAAGTVAVAGRAALDASATQAAAGTVAAPVLVSGAAALDLAITIGATGTLTLGGRAALAAEATLAAEAGTLIFPGGARFAGRVRGTARALAG